MRPQRPVSGPSGEDGFLLPLFRTINPLPNVKPEIELVSEDEHIPPQSDHVAADDNNCACE